MALRARLAAPPVEPQQEWQYHTLQWAAVSARQLAVGERRMEAETYLSKGFSVRGAIEAKQSGWARYGDVARVEQPGRLKGVLVSPEFGQPFLAATQVFDVRPIPRKFLAMEQMATASECLVEDGTILVTRSGSVGRPTLAHAPHRGVVVSDDLLRVYPRLDRDFGWLYAYLHAPQVRAMTSGAKYGHMIKHLETTHVEALPIPVVPDEIAEAFTRRVKHLLDLRNEGYRLTLEAEARFEEALGPLTVSDWGENGFTTRASEAFLSGRRRLDASVHNPGVTTIQRHLVTNGMGMTKVASAGYDVWVPGRYKRVPAEDGVVYRDSADILEVSPDLAKRFADCGFGDEFGGRVKTGWVLIPCSGQVYGIIGSAILATDALNDQVVSNHVMRLAPRSGANVRPGYLVTALSHLRLGRPILKSLAFGSSVPEIEPIDVASLTVVRLKQETEFAIAELAEASATARAEADTVERSIAADASAFIERFISSV